MKYGLSICIPAYDRSQCLHELLKSIIEDSNPETPVQICVSDDGAPAATEAVVRRWQVSYPHIVYHRFPENGGLDRNILKSVELAEGDYCWLMGDDDKVEPGATSHVLQRIAEYQRPTALNVNGYLYDRHLEQQLHSRVLVGLRKSRLDRDQLFDSLEEIVRNFGDSFGFLGDNVFNRALWQEVVSEMDLTPFYGSCYIHLAVLLMILRKSPRYLYVNQHCVGYRGGNDGFLEILGELRRLHLDVNGYTQVAEGVFSKGTRLYKVWMSQVVRFHIRNRVRSIKSVASRQAMRQVSSLTYKHFHELPVFWTSIAPLLIVPRAAFLTLRMFYRATKR